MAQTRGARAILIDADAVTGPQNRQSLVNQGYTTVSIVPDLAGAAQSARMAAPGVIFVSAAMGGEQASQLIQGLKAEDATRHVAIQFLDLPTGTRAPAKGLNSVGRSNW
jgi:AmiR/NasT family two-component response regulator